MNDVSGIPAAPAVPGPTSVFVHLSGSRRGRTEPIAGKTLLVSPYGASGVRFHRPDENSAAGHVVTLHQSGDTYELVAEGDQRVWANGERVDTHLLRSGDLIEIEHGPVLRFRQYPSGGHVHKSVAEVFGDCLDCARNDDRSLVTQAPELLAGMTRDLATQTSIIFRSSVVAALAILTGIIIYQYSETRDLEERLALDQDRIEGLAALLEHTQSRALTREELTALREELEQGMLHTAERVSALEARSAAARRVIAELAPSVVFIQGGFGYQDPETGRPLRLAAGPDGNPVRLPGGRPLITLEGDGPPVEINYTGTAFIIDKTGLLLTNRHVALPWENNKSAPGIEELGLTPVMRRLIGYLPGLGEPFEVELVGASDSADLAFLRCQDIARQRPPLPLSQATPEPGEEVIVLGFPAGMRALLARAGERFVAGLGDLSELDFWEVAQELAAAGLITPLASRGIVGQVSEEAVVYDAETTQGGSGGPVLNLRGEAVAVNTAIIPEFGGSNLGVPMARVRELMTELSITP